MHIHIHTHISLCLEKLVTQHKWVMMILWQRIRLALINFTHVPAQPSFCRTTLLIIRNQSAAMRRLFAHTANCVPRDKHTYMYVHQHLPCCTSLGDWGELEYATMPYKKQEEVEKNSKGERGAERDRMSTTVLLSTFLWPYMVVNHAGKGGAIASLSVWHVTWKQEVLWCREEEEVRERKVTVQLLHGPTLNSLN